MTRQGAVRLFRAAVRPDEALRDDHPFTVERDGRTEVEAKPEIEGLADPAAEGGVVGPVRTR